MKVHEVHRKIITIVKNEIKEGLYVMLINKGSIIPLITYML
jgi:hypothetical protein